MKQEAALCDTVRLVVELVREVLSELLKRLSLEDLGVQARNAVYRETADDREVRHTYLSVVNDRHLLDHVIIAGIGDLDLTDETSVDLLNNLVNTGKKL